MPGLQDTRSSDTGLLGLLATHVAIQTTKLIKRVVIVIDYNDIKNKNAKNLASIVNSVSKIFKNFEKHRGTITLVVSKLQGIKQEPVDKQKLRIIKDLQAFDDAIKQSNYQTEISEKQQVHKFLDLFISSKSLSNLILFNPLNTAAKNELLSAITSSKGFSPKEISFVGDDVHKQTFVVKIKSTLTEAIELLNRLAAYPNSKVKLEEELTKIKNKLSDLKPNTEPTEEEGENKASDRENETSSSTLHSVETLKAKRDDLKDCDLELKRLVARSELHKDKLQQIIETKKQVQDVLIWNEEDDYPGDKGTMLSRNYTLERNVIEGPFQKYEEEAIVDCQRPMSSFTSNHCPDHNNNYQNKNRADSFKDGSIRCYYNTKNIIGYFEGHYTGLNTPTLLNNFRFKVGYEEHSRTLYKYVHTTMENTNSYFKNKYMSKNTKGHLKLTMPNNALGIFKVTYHTPSDCYGRIKVTFWVDYHDKLEVKADMKNLNEKIIKLEESIATKDKEMRAAEFDLLEMEKENKQAIDKQEAAQQQKTRQQKQFVANSEHQTRLEAERAAKQSAIATLQTTYDADFKTYCSQQTFWQRLIDFNTAVQFQLPQYETFSSQFSLMSARVAKKDCLGLTEPLDCDEFSDPGNFEYVDDCVEDEEIIYANGIATNPIANAHVIYDKDRGFLTAKQTLGYQFFKWSNLLIAGAIQLPHSFTSQLLHYTSKSPYFYVNSPEANAYDVASSITSTPSPNIYQPSKLTEPEGTCHPTIHGDPEFGFVPSLICSDPNYQTTVFVKTSDATVVSTRYLGGNAATITGDTYNNCKRISFAGRPSVTCEGEQTTMVYTPDIKPGPMDELGSNVMLLAVFAQWGKNIWGWVTSEPSTVVEQEVRFGISEAERLTRTKQALRIKTTEKNLSNFKKYISHPGAQFLSLSKKYLQGFCNDIENDLIELKQSFKSHISIEGKLAKLETKIPNMRAEIDAEIADMLCPIKEVSNASFSVARNTTFFRPHRVSDLAMLSSANLDEARVNTSMNTLTRAGN